MKVKYFAANRKTTAERIRVSGSRPQRAPLNRHLRTLAERRKLPRTKHKSNDLLRNGIPMFVILLEILMVRKMPTPIGTEGEVPRRFQNPVPWLFAVVCSC